MTEAPPFIADEAPGADTLTAYDQAHFVIYLRLLDAEAEGADWREVAEIVLGLDSATDSEHARRCWESHLRRARWMTQRGHRHLLETVDVAGSQNSASNFG